MGCDGTETRRPAALKTDICIAANEHPPAAYRFSNRGFTCAVTATAGPSRSVNGPRIVSFRWTRLLPRADERVDIRVGDRQPVGIACRRWRSWRSGMLASEISTNAPRTSAQSWPSMTRAWAQRALRKLSTNWRSSLFGQNQGFEVVGVDLGTGNRSEDLAEAGHDALL